MKYTEIAGKKLSDMSLGTVQLGLNYGIANQNGQPDEKQSFEMLQTALENGVTSFDTARAYGTSEDVLGHFFAQYKGELPFITTKILGIEGLPEKEIEKAAFTIAETSLEKLGLKKVNCIMLHRGSNLFENGNTVAKVMEKLIKNGYTDTVGVSIYDGTELEKMFEYDVYTATQIPMSIFDQRLFFSGLTDKLYEKHITTFVRSVFLQGLFFLDPEKITDPILLEHAAPKIKLLQKCAEKENMNIAELAITYIRNIKGVTSLVLGADTADQVKNNAAYFETKTLSEETCELIKKEFARIDIPEIMKVLSRPKK